MQSPGAILVGSHVNFHMTMSFLDKWTQGAEVMDRDVGSVVTRRFLGFLLEFTLHLWEIGSSLGYVVDDSMVINEDKNISMRLALRHRLYNCISWAQD